MPSPAAAGVALCPMSHPPRAPRGQQVIKPTSLFSPHSTGSLGWPDGDVSPSAALRASLAFERIQRSAQRLSRGACGPAVSLAPSPGPAPGGHRGLAQPPWVACPPLQPTVLPSFPSQLEGGLQAFFWPVLLTVARVFCSSPQILLNGRGRACSGLSWPPPGFRPHL